MTSRRLPANERKKQIALVAADLFAQKGFNGVTTREIAATAKVNEGILFRYFPTKEALYTEIIDQKVKVEPSDFNLEAAEKGNDREVFTSIAKFLMSEIERDNTFLRLMLYSALEGHSLSNLFLSSRTNILFEFVENYIRKRGEAGAFRGIDPIVATRMFMGSFFNFIMSRELFKLPDSLKVDDEKLINGFVDIYLNGMVER